MTVRHFWRTASAWVAVLTLSANEIAAANSVELDYLNAQGQPKYTWPTTFALARAYLDQLERSGGLSAEQIASARRQLAAAEAASGSARREMLSTLASELDGEARGARDTKKVQTLTSTVRDLSTASP